MRPFRAAPDPDAEAAAVAIDGFKLTPLADLAAGGRSWEFHPLALAGAAWDSNPLDAIEGSDGDAQLRLGAGFEARALGRGGLRAELGGILRVQRYADTPSRDNVTGDAHVRLRRTGQDTDAIAEGSYARDTDPLFDLPEQAERQRLLGSLAVERGSRDNVLYLGLAYDALDYLEDTSIFGKDDRDRVNLSASAAWHALGGAGSRIGVIASLTRLERPAESVNNSATILTVDGHWVHAFSERTSADLLLGVEARRYDDDSFGDAGNDDRDVLSPSASARLLWNWEERSWCALTASSALDDGLSEGVNASRRHGLATTINLRLLDRLDLSGDLWAVTRTDQAAAPGSERLRVDNVHLRIGPDYRLRDGLGLRLWASWDRQTASNGSDYDRTLVALELLAAL